MASTGGEWGTEDTNTTGIEIKGDCEGNVPHNHTAIVNSSLRPLPALSRATDYRKPRDCLGRNPLPKVLKTLTYIVATITSRSPYSHGQMPVVTRPLHLVPRCPRNELDGGRGSTLWDLPLCPSERTVLAPGEGERHHVAPFPAEELPGAREELPVVPHEVVRHNHRVHVLPRYLKKRRTF